MNEITNEQIEAQQSADKQNVEDFLNGKSPTFDFSAMKRLVLSELTYKHAFKYNRIYGFTRTQIINMSKYPERYGSAIIRLSKYMMLKSGYYKRLVEYFVNMGVINWTVDTEAKTAAIMNVSPNALKSNYIKFVAQCNKFKIDNRITDILRKLFVEDACFGYIDENDTDCSIYFIDPQYCEIKKLVNGNVFEYAINRSLITSSYFDTLPQSLQDLLNKSKETSLNNMVMMPYERSLCLKYHVDFTYLYPPFFGLIAAILAIDDYKDLAKAKTEADAYKLIYFKIPVTDNGQIAMGDEIVVPFVQMAKDIVPETWGVVPAPMELSLVESKSTADDDDDKTENAVSNFYTEAGISKALISSASSGSELKYSIRVDSADIFRIYRQIEAWMNLQLKLRGFIYKSYEFIYNIINMTVFDTDDVIDREIKLAQASLPNKSKLLAASGINPAKMIGNSIMENNVLYDEIFAQWKPLQTSYTMSSADDEGGRPEIDEDDLSPEGEQTRNNDDNDKANRDV